MDIAPRHWIRAASDRSQPFHSGRAQYQVLVDYHQKHGDTAAAAKVLERMAELDPDDPTPRVRLSEIHHQSGDRERELAELRALAELMMRHQRYDEAAQIFGRAISAAPDGETGNVAKTSEITMPGAP